MAVVTHLHPICELDSRASGGIEVTLVWNRRSNELTVCVSDSHTGDYFELEVAPDKALDVFHHPYAHASARDIPAMPADASATAAERPSKRAA
jgi:hypothetical protein